MEIYARFLDKNTFEPFTVPQIYLQIISDNHEYYHTRLRKQNSSILHIAVGTAEMRDSEYVVKVSDHKEMLSFGFNKVKVNSRKFFMKKNRLPLQQINAR